MPGCCRVNNSASQGLRGPGLPIPLRVDSLALFGFVPQQSRGLLACHYSSLLSNAAEGIVLATLQERPLFGFLPPPHTRPAVKREDIFVVTHVLLELTNDFSIREAFQHP